MAIKDYHPTSAGMRFRTGLIFDEITKKRPEKGLSQSLKQQEANMTFNFRNWPAGHDNVRPLRARLIARWQRGTDGKLECRWRHQPSLHVPD